MTNIDPYGVRIHSSEISYADGAESDVLRALEDSADRSEGSDELAARISDWPSRYHFSPLRTNLLRPLRIRSGLRVLDFGCGSGAITRWLGEQGAHVVGVEGSLDRARAAAVRCQGVSNVEIRAGTLDALSDDENFDLIVMVGVLEYAPVFGGADGPGQLLESIRHHLHAGGALALAIENQLGLKYLLGSSEDHRQLQWVGVEGYGRSPGPRTWHRRRLSAMLSTAGFPAQRWLFPFPDYKLPSCILTEAMYARSPELVDHFVRSPIAPDASVVNLVCDARAAHRELLEAGIGPEVANSFLVVCASDETACSDFLGDELAWLFGSSRRRQWRRFRAVVEVDGGARIEDRSDPSAPRTLSWLSQAVTTSKSRPIVPGTPLDILLQSALRLGDLDAAAELLQRWKEFLLRQVEKTDLSGSEACPFAPLASEDALPGDYLDVVLPNFVDSDGELAFIDREWIAASPVSSNLVLVRALWWFAQALIELGEPHPWGPLATVDDVCQTLCRLVNIECPNALFVRLRAAEADLQHLVHGNHRDEIEATIHSISKQRTIDAAPAALPFTALHAAVGAGQEQARALGEEIEAVRAELQSARERAEELQFRFEVQMEEKGRLQAHADALEGAVTHLRGCISERDDHIHHLQEEQLHLQETLAKSEEGVAELQAESSRLQQEIDTLNNRFMALERRLPVRLYRAVRSIHRP